MRCSLFWRVATPLAFVATVVATAPAWAQDCLHSNHDPRCWDTGGIPRGFTTGGPLPANKLKAPPVVALPIPAPLPQQEESRVQVCRWSGPQYGAKIPYPANFANGCPAQPRGW